MQVKLNQMAKKNQVRLELIKMQVQVNKLVSLMKITLGTLQSNHLLILIKALKLNLILKLNQVLQLQINMTN